jgi:isopenicillin N synthase-like dioxygenase
MPVPLTLPIISISPYLSSRKVQCSDADRAKVADDIHRACRDIGFFYLKVDDYLEEREMHSVLERGREFFLQATDDEKAEIGLQQGDGVRGESVMPRIPSLGSPTS